MMLYCFFVEIIGFPFYHVEGIVRALSEAGAKTVALLFCRQAGLAINNLNGPLGAGRHTLSAAVAFIFFYLYYFTFDFHFPLLLSSYP